MVRGVQGLVQVLTGNPAHTWGQRCLEREFVVGSFTPNLSCLKNKGGNEFLKLPVKSVEAAETLALPQNRHL